MNLVFDIETDDLDASIIWCIVALDVDTKEVHTFNPSEIDEGIMFLSKADKLIGHNIIGFDIPVINKLKNVNLFDKKIVDTLVLSRLFNPTREGGHSLESWGYRLGHNKLEFKEFKEYSNEMLTYCINDVELNYRVYNKLKEESRGFSQQSIELEHDVMKIVCQQREHGFLLDERKAMLLVSELEEKLNETTKEVRKVFKPKVEEHILRPRYNNDGSLSKFANCRQLKKRVRLTEDEYKEMSISKKVKRCIKTDFNLGSRKQIGEYLIDFGWKPKKFTPTNQPMVDEKILQGIKDIPQATLIATYLMLQKRIAQVSSWLKELKDGRIHGYVNPNGTITGRMTHSNPNTGQIPSTRAEYGKECRSCWTVPKGYKLCGIDASQLELRMLAHYMNDKEYTNEIINGDIHTTNQKLAGLKSRDQAKVFIYALCYGAGSRKLSTILGGSVKDAERIRDSFLYNLPSFRDLKDRVGRASKKGFLKGIDNRKLIVRSEHAALNTLLQGAGSIVMKQALVLFNHYIRDLDAKIVANVHDEWQVEVKEDQAEEVGKRGVQAIIDTAPILKLNCPLDGAYNVGDNWSETH